jgi:hypothetical protein
MITDPNGLALLFLSFLASWPDPDSELPDTVSLPNHDLINSGVWGYQLYLFQRRVLDQWGEQVQQRVKQAHARILGADRVADLATMTDIISAAIRHSLPEIERLARNGDDRGMAIDLTVALALLKRQTPANGQRISASAITEYHLANCLGRGRRRIETAITPLIASMEMAGDGASASLFEQFQSPLKYYGTRK